MEDKFFEELREFGVDVTGVLQRFVGNGELFKKFLFKFIDDANMEKFKKDVEARDYESLVRTSHTLKGVTGNLGITPLYNIFSEMSDDLKNGVSDGDGIDGQYKEAAEYYENLCGLLKKHKGQ